jgi:hypothetical protein
MVDAAHDDDDDDDEVGNNDLSATQKVYLWNGHGRL